MSRVLPIVLAVVAVLCFAGGPLLAQDTQTHQGKVVSVTGSKLVMTMKDSDKQHTHTIATDAKITLDGKEATSAELRPGMEITVTTAKNDVKTATKIEALSKRSRDR